MTMAMGCATSSAREGDPGWEVDAGMSEGDANVATPSLAYEIPPQCPNGYASTYPPGQACMGTGTRAHCSGTRGTGYPSFCAGPCVIPATSTPEVCDGIDNDCDGLLNENPAAICDDGYDCTADSCQNYGYGFYGCLNPMPSTCQEIQRPVAESRIAADGVTWLMRRDNPRLRGRVFARVDGQLGRDDADHACCAIKTMSPFAAAIFSNSSANVEPGISPVGWLYSENTLGAPAAIGGFRAPQVLMNITGATEIVMLGYSNDQYELRDQIRMEMDPHVLIVPVRTTTFVTSPGSTEVAMRALFEPAMVQSQSYALTATTATAVSQVVGPGVYADDVWTQCDIQFRLVEARTVVNSTLAATVATSCNCQGSNGILGAVGARTPLGAYIDSVGGTHQTALDIFIGDNILNTGPSCNSGVVAQACGASFTCQHLTEGSTSNSSNFWGMTVERSALYSLPHELGHMLGLGHAFDEHMQGVRVTPIVPSCVTPAFSSPFANNLMGGASQSGPLVPAQCSIARCDAARWMERFGQISSARRAAVCAGG